MSAERTILRTAIDNAELVNRLGDRAVVVLEDAARAVAAQLLTAKGPATVMALQAQLASIRDTFRAAGIKTYSQFVDDLAYQLSTFEGRSEAVIRAVVGDAVEAGSQALAGGTVGPAAGVAVGTVGAGATPAAVLQTVATMGPLELTVLAAQQEYSLGREFARAFLTPTNGVMRQEVEAQAARLSDLFEKRVRSAVVTGQTNQEVVKQLMGDGREITGDAAMSIRSARTLVRTGVQQVANAVNHSTIMANPAVEKVEFIATLDGRTSATCFVGSTVFDPVGEVAAISSRFYEGEVLIVTTAAGKQLIGTPNHPVLTAEGWCPLQELKPGKSILYAVTRNHAIAGDKNVDVPASIAEIADALSNPAASHVFSESAAPDQFHGDGMTGDYKVHIACPKSELRGAVVTGGLKQAQEFCFGPGLRPAKQLSGLGSLGLGIEGHSALIGVTPLLDAMPFENFVQPAFGSLSAQAIDNVSRADAGIEQLKCRDGVSKNVGIGNTFGQDGHDSKVLEHCRNSGDGSSVLPGDLASRGSALVEADYVVEVRSEFRSEQVFNVETTASYYTANGFIVHNCRAMSGRIFDKDKAPRPPLHWNCRSLVVGWRPTGDHGHRSMTMGVVQDDGSVKYLPAYGDREGFTAAQMRLIKQNNQGYAVDYRDWLSAQPKAVQVDILGAKRQAIFQKTGSLVLSSAPSEQKAIKAAGYSDGRRMPRRVRASQPPS